MYCIVYRRPNMTFYPWHEFKDTINKVMEFTNNLDKSTLGYDYAVLQEIDDYESFKEENLEESK